MYWGCETSSYSATSTITTTTTGSRTCSTTTADGSPKPAGAPTHPENAGVRPDGMDLFFDTAGRAACATALAQAPSLA